MTRVALLLLAAASLLCACASEGGSGEPGPGGGGAAGGAAGGGGGDGAGGTGGGGGEPPAITYHRDVRPIVAARCAGCHGPSRVGPLALGSHDDVAGHATEILAALDDGSMPPWAPAAGCTSYEGDRSLAAGERDTFAGWIALGMPEGDPATAPPAPGPPPGLSRVDLSLQMPAAHTPAIPAERRCFPIPWPRGTVTYVSGFNVNPGESRIVHHANAWVIPPARVAEVRALDDADPAPGYRCGEPSDGTVPWLGEWAAGSKGEDYPAGTGIKVPPGSLVLLQLHYATAAFAGSIPPEDRSSIDFKLDDLVDREAVILPLFNPGWLPARGGNLRIPAGEAEVVHSYTADLARSMGTISGGVISSNQPFAIERAGLLLRGFGTSARLGVDHLDGSSGCLVDVPVHRPLWRESYRLTTRVVVQPGDPLTVTCQYDNSAANQPLDDQGQPLPPVDVAWGDGERDELCLGFVYATRL